MTKKIETPGDGAILAEVDDWDFYDTDVEAFGDEFEITVLQEAFDETPLEELPIMTREELGLPEIDFEPGDDVNELLEDLERERKKKTKRADDDDLFDV